MTKIYCADVSCEFNNDKGVCSQKTVCLGWSSVMTVWDGRQEFHRCKSYQKSKQSIEIESQMRKYMEDQQVLSFNDK